jgi:hypothetical protein
VEFLSTVASPPSQPSLISYILQHGQLRQRITGQDCTRNRSSSRRPYISPNPRLFLRGAPSQQSTRVPYFYQWQVLSAGRSRGQSPQRHLNVEAARHRKVGLDCHSCRQSAERLRVLKLPRRQGIWRSICLGALLHWHDFIYCSLARWSRRQHSSCRQR